MMKRLAALALVVVATVAGGWWWLERDAASETAAGAPSRAITVELAAVATDTARERFRTVGEIVATDQVALTAEAIGVVAELPVEDGDRVARGDLVLRLEEEEERAALAAAEAALAEAEADLRRARELAEQDFAAEQRVETARAAFERAQAERERAAVRLNDRRVVAPFDGRLGLVEVSPGSLVEPGTTIGLLYSIDRLEVHVDLPQRVAERIAPGATVELGDQRLEIATLTPAADAVTRTVTAIAPLGETPRTRFVPGAFVDVAVVVDVRDAALFVPETAILRVGERAYVFRAEDGRAKRVEVETGIRREGRIEIRGDVTAGEQIVASGLEKLRDGAPITPAGGPTS